MESNGSLHSSINLPLWSLYVIKIQAWCILPAYHTTRKRKVYRVNYCWHTPGHWEWTRTVIFSLLQTSSLPFHVFSLPEAEVLYKDNCLCFGLIRTLSHLKGHVCKGQQFFISGDLYADFGGELWESKPIEANSGNVCLKENITVISLLYPLN